MCDSRSELYCRKSEKRTFLNPPCVVHCECEFPLPREYRSPLDTHAMGSGRQRDFTKARAKETMKPWQVASVSMSVNRMSGHTSSFTNFITISHTTLKYREAKQELSKHLSRSGGISSADFMFNFNSYNQASCLFLFRFGCLMS